MKKREKEEDFVASEEYVRRKKEKRKKRPLLFFLFIFVLLGAAVVGLSVLLLKVEQIRVRGDTRYGEKDILSASGILIGDTFFDLHPGQIERRIATQYPYIEHVKVQYHLGGQVELFLTEAIPTYVVEKEGQYVLLSENLKVLEKMSTYDPNLNIGTPILKGFPLKEAVVGEVVITEKEQDSEKFFLIDLAEYSRKYGINRLTEVDMMRIKMIYNRNVLIQFGSKDRLEAKCWNIRFLLDAEYTGQENAVVDASLLESEEKPQIRFLRIDSLEDYLEERAGWSGTVPPDLSSSSSGTESGESQTENGASESSASLGTSSKESSGESGMVGAASGNSSKNG